MNWILLLVGFAAAMPPAATSDDRRVAPAMERSFPAELLSREQVSCRVSISNGDFLNTRECAIEVRAASSPSCDALFFDVQAITPAPPSTDRREVRSFVLAEGRAGGTCPCSSKEVIRRSHEPELLTAVSRYPLSSVKWIDYTEACRKRGDCGLQTRFVVGIEAAADIPGERWSFFLKAVRPFAVPDSDASLCEQVRAGFGARLSFETRTAAGP